MEPKLSGRRAGLLKLQHALCQDYVALAQTIDELDFQRRHTHSAKRIQEIKVLADRLKPLVHALQDGCEQVHKALMKKEEPSKEKMFAKELKLFKK